MPRETGIQKRVKSKRLIKAYIDADCNQAELARRQGVTPQTIGKKLKKRKVLQTIEKRLDKEGINDTYLAKKLKEGLEATKVISANIIEIKSDDPTVKEKKAHSRTMDFIDVPDLNTRYKYLMLAFELRGHIKRGASGDTGHKVFNFIYGHRSEIDNSAVREGSRGRAELSKPDTEIGS